MHQWIPVAILTLAAIVGVALTVITLPGVWLIVASSAAVALWKPEVMPWWAVGVTGGLAVVAEVVEFAAGAMGAAKFKATRAGAIGAVVGSIVGAIVGSPFFFPLGTIVGGIAGAGIGAAVAERGYSKRTWAESAKVGGGAAAGRLVATVVKTCLALIMGVFVTVVALAHA